ncbi:MAG: hypothetical protein AB9880_07085 [Christensenellales bacterium]
MKQNPKNEQTRANLQAGKLAKEGFLGGDTRAVEEIIASDAASLQGRGLNPQDLAAAMLSLTRLGLAGMGSWVDTKDYTVKVEEFMGFMPCPFRDGRRAAKRNTEARSKATGKTLTWTDMGLHLIQAHGFFQGEGSAYRLDPLELADFLGLGKEA